jgi:exopolyphosphatase/guanosine-5'-triphosphate,3'-diphosphate pyrophosphatase
MMGEKIHNQKYAVIDIGSNTIRFVVYETISRHPYIYFNEKAQCKLGKFNKEGALSKSCKECAREALERFSTLIKTMDIKNVSAIATAALRDAIDGVSFAKELSDLLGINVDIISGLQEGYYAASGVLFGLYCAQGVVADLGGGSLELIEIDDKRTIHGGVTMPLGTIRLAEIVERTGIGEGFKNAIYEYLEENLQKIRYTQKTLYIVGGSWRALSLSYLNHTKYPINVLQGYEMNAKDLAKYCIELSKKNIKDLAQIPNISKRRLLSLPLSSILLACLIEKGNFEKVVVSIYHNIFKCKTHLLVLRLMLHY